MDPVALWAAIVALPCTALVVTFDGLRTVFSPLVDQVAPVSAEAVWAFACGDRHHDMALNFAISFWFVPQLAECPKAGRQDTLDALVAVHGRARSIGYLERTTLSGTLQSLPLPHLGTAARQFLGAATCRRLLGIYPPNQSWMTTPFDIAGLFIRLQPDGTHAVPTSP